MIISGVGGAGMIRNARIKVTGSAMTSPMKAIAIRRVQTARLFLRRPSLRRSLFFARGARERRFDPLALEMFGSNAFKGE